MLYVVHLLQVFYSCNVIALIGQGACGGVVASNQLASRKLSLPSVPCCHQVKRILNKNLKQSVISRSYAPVHGPTSLDTTGNR